MFTLKVLQALRWGGLGIAGTLLLSLLGGELGHAQAAPPGVVLVVGAAYLLSFWHATDATRSHIVRRRWSVGLSVPALVLYGLFPLHPYVGALLVAVASVLPMHLRPAPALAWLTVQSAALLPLLSPSLGVPAALVETLWALGMQGALALMMFLVFEHLQVRREWFNLAAHLTRQVREAERARISRDLHDLLGHDLALLGAELEYARRFRDDEAVGRARALVTRLFDDLRGTVGALRHAPGGGGAGPGGVSWGEVLRPLDVSVPGLSLHVAVPPGTPVPDAAGQGALSMVVQEALTNTVRHAGASNFFVEVRPEARAVVVCLRDDGRARGPLVPGHGLRGMRERLEAVGGSLTVGTLRRGSVQVWARVPLAEDPR